MVIGMEQWGGRWREKRENDVIGDRDGAMGRKMDRKERENVVIGAELCAMEMSGRHSS